MRDARRRAGRARAWAMWRWRQPACAWGRRTGDECRVARGAVWVAGRRELEMDAWDVCEAVGTVGVALAVGHYDTDHRGAWSITTLRVP